MPPYRPAPTPQHAWSVSATLLDSSGTSFVRM
jgi:hypothetical protein